MLGGLLAIGLIAALSSNHDDKAASNAPSLSQGSTATTTTSQTTNKISSDEQRAFELLNADRVANGLSPLKLNLALTAVAERHAQDEINRNFFAHDNPDVKQKENNPESDRRLVNLP